MRVFFQRAHGDGYGSLYRDYTGDFGRVQSLFNYDPGAFSSYSRRLAALKESPAYAALRPGHRESAAALLDLNRALGADPAALKNLELLASGAAVAVVAGQQACLALGPLFVAFKAAAAIKLAERAQAELGHPVVPLFWVASEDHDYDEISRITVLDGEHLVDLALPAAGAPRRSVGHTPIPREAAGLLEELAARTGQWLAGAGQAGGAAREQGAEALALAEAARASSSSLAEWFERLLLALFSRRGLAVVDPMCPALRRLAAPVVKGALAAGSALAAEVRRGALDLVRAGHRAVLDLEDDHSCLFAYIDGERTALHWRDGRLYGRRGEAGWLPEDALAALAADAGRFSPNAALRPIVQEHLVPVLAAVCGPSELSYASQLRGVFRAFGLEMPPLYPRLSLTLVEPEHTATLAELGLSPQDLQAGSNGLAAAHLATRGGGQLQALFSAEREAVAARHGALVRAVAQLGVDLDDLGPQNVERILGQYAYLEHKATQRHRQQHAQPLRRLAAVHAALYPHGRQQEKGLAFLPFFIRHGPDLVDMLTDDAPLAGEHHFCYLGGRPAGAG